MLLKPYASQAGVTLIELMIAVALVGVLLLLGLPEYADYMRNNRIRNAAESTTTGLKLARAEAIRRNTHIRFDLMDSLESSCTQNVTASAWTITLNIDPAGKCDTAPSEAPDSSKPLLKKWLNTEGAKDVSLNGADSATTVIFSPMGRISPAGAGTADLKQIDVKTSSSNGRNLRILIDAGGSIFMCDPNTTDEIRKCP